MITVWTPSFLVQSSQTRKTNERRFTTGNAYYTLFPTLATHGIQTHAFDQRGWGRSVQNDITKRGLTGPTSQVLADINSFLCTLLPFTIPVFLMGHSMGGGEILAYAALGPQSVREQITGYLAEAPFIAFPPPAAPSRLKVLLGRFAGKWMPERQMVQKLDAEQLCRDKQVCKDWVEDELCHDTGTLEGLSGMLERAEHLASGKVKIQGENVRVWVGHGSADTVTSFEASKKFMGELSVQDKEFRAYDGWFHKCRCLFTLRRACLLTCDTVHAEPGEDKITFANDVAAWILARSSPSNAQGPRL